MAIKIGITGGIGSGKSVVSRLLRVMGIPVYISDEEAKRITSTDKIIRHRLCSLISESVYEGDRLNKPLLASYIFENPVHAREVNAIIHPRVREDFRCWTIKHVQFPVVGLESAILIEAGFDCEVDMVVMVYAPFEVRVQRAVQRDHSTREQILKRVESQMNDEEKRKRADFVIANDGETPLIPQVLELISFLSKNNHYLCRAKK